jgi:transcriptional regulator with XRE-family HTH domain
MASPETLETDLKAEQESNALGRRIRTLRKTQDRTLDSLAQEIGLTKGYLSKVETGRQIPPLGTLSKLAKALGTDLAAFVETESRQDPEYRGVSVVRAQERRHVVRGATSFGYDYQSLVQSSSGKHMSPFLFTFPSQILKEVFFEHSGEEMIFVLSGVVEFEVGTDSFELTPGDCIYFDSRLRHRGRGKYGEAKALVVLYDPGNRGQRPSD